MCDSWSVASRLCSVTQPALDGWVEALSRGKTHDGPKVAWLEDLQAGDDESGVAGQFDPLAAHALRRLRPHLPDVAMWQVNLGCPRSSGPPSIVRMPPGFPTTLAHIGLPLSGVQLLVHRPLVLSSLVLPLVLRLAFSLLRPLRSSSMAGVPDGLALLPRPLP